MEVARTAPSKTAGMGSSVAFRPNATAAGAPQCGHINAVVLIGWAHSAQAVMAMP
jgi:hypothetical protein